MPSSILAEEMENDISSEVITLRPFKESDADDFLGYAGDDQVTRFTRWNTFSCKEEALVYIKDFCIPHPYCRSICVNDRSIGFVFIRQESGDDKRRAELGYAIAAKYWGQGVTTRALKMAISDGLRSFPDLVRLQARADVENKASQRVLEKLGFLKEGVLRKYMYNKVIGFFMRFEDDSVESAKIVKQWNVKIISISKNKRHKDRAAALEMWDRLEEFMRSRSHT